MNHLDILLTWSPGWYLRVCISNKFPGDVDGAAPRTSLWEPPVFENPQYVPGSASSLFLNADPPHFIPGLFNTCPSIHFSAIPFAFILFHPQITFPMQLGQNSLAISPSPHREGESFPSRSYHFPHSAIKSVRVSNYWPTCLSASTDCGVLNGRKHISLSSGSARQQEFNSVWRQEELIN